MSLFLYVDPFLASVFTDIAKGIVFTLFVIAAVVLSVVILLQEGKGGGLGSAFGGAAADAFGVKAGSVSKFTTYLASAFLGLALLYSALASQGDRVSTTIIEPTIDGPPTDAAPAEPGAGDAPSEAPPAEAPAPGDGN